MNDVFQKFILKEDDKLGLCMILAKCTFHKQLTTDHDKVRGGGMWQYIKDNNEMLLFGKSYDFGACSLEDLKHVVQNNKVFKNSRLIRDITDKYNFIWQDLDDGIEINLKNKI